MKCMHHRRGILAGWVASLVAASLIALPAAVADTGSFGDPAYDIRAGEDILSVQVTNERRVAVVVRHRDLRRSATPAVSVMVDTYPNRPGPEFSVDLNIYELYVWRVRRWQSYGETPIGCPVTGGFDYRAASALRGTDLGVKERRPGRHAAEVVEATTADDELAQVDGLSFV